MDDTDLGRSGVSVADSARHHELRVFTSEADAQTIMDAAHEHGIELLRHLQHYGRPGRGRHQLRSSAADGGGSGRRDRTVLATSCTGGKGEWPNDRLPSAPNIRRARQETLR